MSFRSFASDNNAGIHPEFLNAIVSANSGHCRGYGDDSWTERARASLTRELGSGSQAFFVFNGTGANVLALESCLKPHEAVICAEGAHIQVDECGAPERYIGCKLIPVPTHDGKLTPDAIRAQALRGVGDPHHVQPKVVSISQSTEVGTVYSLSELKAISSLCRELGLYLHVDGARLSNAAASLGVSLGQCTAEVGVDVLSLGGTKLGMLGAECVVFFNRALAEGFLYRRKQSMQLASKHRFLAVQFERFCQDGLWRQIAAHANRMAAELCASIRGIPGVEITQAVQANGVFARVPERVVKPLQAQSFFYVWSQTPGTDPVIRLMTSWDTQPEDIQAFSASLKRLVIESES